MLVAQVRLIFVMGKADNRFVKQLPGWPLCAYLPTYHSSSIYEHFSSKTKHISLYYPNIALFCFTCLSLHEESGSSFVAQILLTGEECTCRSGATHQPAERGQSHADYRWPEGTNCSPADECRISKLCRSSW